MEDLWWLQRSIEFNVYYYHCITERCYYLFGVEKKYYIFKPPLFSSFQNHPLLVSFSQVARFLSSRLLSPPTPFVLARGEHRLSITIYSDSRSTSGSNLTGLCTLKNAYLRAPPCLAALNCKATRVSPTHSNHWSSSTLVWKRLSRFLRALHLDEGVYSRYIYSVLDDNNWMIGRFS